MGEENKLSLWYNPVKREAIWYWLWLTTIAVSPRQVSPWESSYYILTLNWAQWQFSLHYQTTAWQPRCDNENYILNFISFICSICKRRTLAPVMAMEKKSKINHTHWIGVFFLLEIRLRVGFPFESTFPMCFTGELLRYQLLLSVPHKIIKSLISMSDVRKFPQHIFACCIELTDIYIWQ